MPVFYSQLPIFYKNEYTHGETILPIKKLLSLIHIFREIFRFLEDFQLEYWLLLSTINLKISRL